jgi:hypothetical protein
VSIVFGVLVKLTICSLIYQSLLHQVLLWLQAVQRSFHFLSNKKLLLIFFIFNCSLFYENRKTSAFIESVTDTSLGKPAFQEQYSNKISLLQRLDFYNVWGHHFIWLIAPQPAHDLPIGHLHAFPIHSSAARSTCSLRWKEAKKYCSLICCERKTLFLCWKNTADQLKPWETFVQWTSYS